MANEISRRAALRVIGSTILGAGAIALVGCGDDLEGRVNRTPSDNSPSNDGLTTADLTAYGEDGDYARFHDTVNFGDFSREYGISSASPRSAYEVLLDNVLDLTGGSLDKGSREDILFRMLKAHDRIPGQSQDAVSEYDDVRFLKPSTIRELIAEYSPNNKANLKSIPPEENVIRAPLTIYTNGDFVRYTVQKDDTINDILINVFNYDPNELHLWGKARVDMINKNKMAGLIDDPDQLTVGQTLLIPERAGYNTSTSK